MAKKTDLYENYSNWSQLYSVLYTFELMNFIIEATLTYTDLVINYSMSQTYINILNVINYSINSYLKYITGTKNDLFQTLPT